MWSSWPVITLNETFDHHGKIWVYRKKCGHVVLNLVNECEKHGSITNSGG